MNVRRRSKIRDMLDQLVPIEEPIAGLDFASEEASSFIAFLRNGQEDPTFLEVFERLWNRLLSPEAVAGETGSQGPYRVFTDEEEQFLSIEARGYLLKLYASGLIGPTQLETAIDRAFECWTEEIDLDQVRFLVAAVLLHDLFSYEGPDRGSSSQPFCGLD